MHTDIKEYIYKAFNTFKRRCIVISPGLKIIAANENVTGGIPEDFIGKLCYEKLKGSSSPCIDCPSHEAARTSQPATKTRHDIFENLNNEICLHAYPILKDGKVDALVMLDFNFPVMKELGDKYASSYAFFFNLIHSAIDGIIAADMTGKIVIFNEAASKISGYSVEEALTSLNIRNLYPEDGARDVMRKLRSDDYGGKGKLNSTKVDYLRKSGEIIPISINASIVYEESKEVASIGFFHDLREELKIEKDLEKTQTQLLQSEKMASLGKLAAGVAHQLNNPLGSITLFTKLILEEYELDDGLEQDLNRILQDAQRCRDTIKELLEFSRQTRHLKRPTDINGAITRTLFLLENQTLFQNIDIEKNMALSLPLVFADIQQLNHVFMNIILNAADAMDGKGKLGIKTFLLLEKNTICIEVSDSGPGIPKEIISRIFEPFYTTKKEGKGTGLGLSMAYSIVEDHGGNIRVESKEGKGTVFIIELPVERHVD
jgi:PAS domain S-box-containing protein